VERGRAAHRLHRPGRRDEQRHLRRQRPARLGHLHPGRPVRLHPELCLGYHEQRSAVAHGLGERLHLRGPWCSRRAGRPGGRDCHLPGYRCSRLGPRDCQLVRCPDRHDQLRRLWQPADCGGGGLTATTPFGYAGGYTDPDGLIYLIHRYYDPATGQFTSADPDAATTGEPYAYAGGDPVDATDPTGLCAESWCPPPPAHGSNPAPSHYGPGTSKTIGALDSVVVKPKPKPRPKPVTRKPAKAKTSLARAVSLGAGCSGTLLKLGACASERGAAGTTAQQVKQSAIGATLILLGAIPIGDILDAFAGAEDAGDLADAATCAGGQSFTAGTKVLLASGIAVPIASLRPGDKVLATNTKTGKTQAETVTAVLVHHDTDLYNLTIKNGRRDAVIHTTRNHLFFDLTRSRWVKAGALKRGDRLRTPSDIAVWVIGGHGDAAPSAWMWDLTIPGDHDFYIQVAETATLVHNCPAAGDGSSTVSDVLRGKLGSITRAPLPSGSPSWSDIMDMTMDEVRAAARAKQPGFKTILKLLTDSRFNK
jgi:RHS repeat-associated protein